MTVRRFILVIRPEPERPATVSTFHQPCENLCSFVFPLPASALYLLLYLPEHVFINQRFVGIFHPVPFFLRLAYLLPALE